MKEMIKEIDFQFLQIHRASRQIIVRTPAEGLYECPFEFDQSLSIGECVLRSAGKVEQTVGGFTTRLWDDPFEWTLPEELSDVNKVLEYLDEVEEKRKDGFEYFSNDDSLTKEILAPDGMRSLLHILLRTIKEASIFQSRAVLVLNFLLSNREPRQKL